MNQRFVIGCLVAIVACASGVPDCALAVQQSNAVPAPQRLAVDSPFAPVTDIEGLPRVLLLGDSISIGYTVGVRNLLDGKANVHRAGVNCGPTSRGVEQLDSWLGESEWDVIHFNFGLHDLKYMDDEGKLVDAGSGHQQHPPLVYQENLDSIVRRLKETGAKLVWCTTTPVPDGARGRIPGDAAAYNEIAAAVVEAAGGIETNDLHAFCAERLDSLQKPADVHFTAGGSRQLALRVARAIEQQLEREEPVEETATGYVFDDANGNGIRDDSESGMAAVRVSNGREITITDDVGRYELPVKGDTTIFVIKPQGWRTALSEDNLPRFYYTHKPNGSPVSYYAGVAPTGPLPEEINFPLYRQDEPAQFKALMWGDPQPRNQTEVDYIAHDVVEELIGTDASFGVTLGDVMFDNLNLYETQNQLVALIGIPWYNVIGNHDLNFDADIDSLSDETFERVFGPAYYSFDYGSVHFIVLDNVVWTTDDDGNKRYFGGIGEDQLEFVRSDLALIPENQLVVLMMHIPLVGVEDRQELYRLIEQRPFCMSISGHTHTHEHRFIGRDDGWLGAEPHHHVINVTVSGAWWSGMPDERGIPHTVMRDGAPNGYSIISFDGEKYSLEFRAAGRPANYQMTIDLPEAVNASGLNGTDLWANIFNGSSRSEVEFRVDDSQEWLSMTRKEVEDPVLERLYEREAAMREKLLEAGVGLANMPSEMSRPRPSSHLWHARLPDGLTPGVHVVEVRELGLNGEYVFGRRTFRVTGE
ncbi:MAG: calcineurin-like phosphoesterase C-terminal domain-containing protein [Planctomycetota bacterium]